MRESKSRDSRSNVKYVKVQMEKCYLLYLPLYHLLKRLSFVSELKIRTPKKYNKIAHNPQKKLSEQLSIPTPYMIARNLVFKLSSNI
jgi:hypothetical protein